MSDNGDFKSRPLLDVMIVGDNYDSYPNHPLKDNTARPFSSSQNKLSHSQTELPSHGVLINKVNSIFELVFLHDNQEFKRFSWSIVFE